MTGVMDFTEAELAMADAITSSLPGRPFGDMRLVGAEVVAFLKDHGYEMRRPDPLPTEARARSGDPQTSKQAALTIDNMTDRQFAVLRVAESFYQPFTYDDLIRKYQARYEDGHRIGREFHTRELHELPSQEPSSIRTRCKELRASDWVVEAGRGMSDAGRPCNLWEVA